jgi:CheY-like chemotaxis protein
MSGVSLTDYKPRNHISYRAVVAQASSSRNGDAKKSAHKGSSTPAKAPAPHRVLICEDQRDTAESLAMILRLEGHEVVVCQDGAAALAQVEKWRPSVAIIDIGLPGVSGYAVAQHIRRLDFGPDVLLIAVTGYGTAADIEMARYAGFDWHFAKPAHPTFVIEVLRDPQRSPVSRRDGTPLHRE